MYKHGNCPLKLAVKRPPELAVPERWLNGVGFERWYVGVTQPHLMNRQQKRDRYQRVEGHTKAARLGTILILLDEQPINTQARTLFTRLNQSY